MCEGKKGICANQMKRHLGVTYKTAWFMCHRIRKAMSDDSIDPLGSEGQVVEIDESLYWRDTTAERPARSAQAQSQGTRHCGTGRESPSSEG